MTNVRFRIKLNILLVIVSHYASVNSPPALAISTGDGTFAILSRPGGWAFAYPVATSGHLTHVFLKVPLMRSAEKTRRLWSNNSVIYTRLVRQGLEKLVDVFKGVFSILDIT